MEKSTTQLLKELRERTGAGVLDCKKALDATNNDIEEAIKWLREKGMAKAVKKASRVSAEGLFEVLVNGNKALFYEINCETDFVAKNEKFKNFQKEVGEVLVASGVSNTEDALEALNAKGVKVSDMVLEFTAIIGEKITLRNVSVVEKADNQVFGVYKHNGGKIAVVTVVEGADAQLAKVLAMTICANNPLYKDESQVSQEWLDNEREVLTKEAKEQNPNKPEQIIAKMIEGRLQKELKEVCLVHQGVITDPNTPVDAFLKANNAILVNYQRKVVGEGIEKKESDFVKEVMEQIQ
ncbi:MAG: translation elongation factor Ts [Gammaproteobacteria bacterium]|nr:translation elongation factor Ts [Gammaproteobacteria bacterium]